MIIGAKYLGLALSKLTKIVNINIILTLSIRIIICNIRDINI